MEWTYKYYVAMADNYTMNNRFYQMCQVLVTF